MTMICPGCWGLRGSCQTCNGKGSIPDVQLSRHFRLRDLLRSDTAVAHGISNVPTAKHLERLIALCRNLLDPLWDEFGALVVTSGLRVEKLNSHPRVKGSSTSAHVVGWAADVQPMVATLDEVMDWIAASDLRFDQAIREPSWIHLGYKRPSSGEQRQEVKRAVGGGKYVPWDTVSGQFTPRTTEKDRCRLR